MCLGTRRRVRAHGAEPADVALRILAFAILAGVGAHNLYYASTHGAFPSGEGDHRYVSIAKMVEQATEPSAVIFTGQHSGPIRYYAGRTIVRFDLLDRAWLDRAVQWLNAARPAPVFPARGMGDDGIPAAILCLERARHDCARAGRRIPRAGCAGARSTCSIPRAPMAATLITTPPPAPTPSAWAPSPLLHLR